MDYADDQDDVFGDADFDDLPPNTLQALEQRALSFTQQQAAQSSAPPSQTPPDVLNGIHAARNNSNHASQRNPNPAGAQHFDDYGFDDEDVINLDDQQPFSKSNAFSRPTPTPPQQKPVVDQVTQREQWRLNKYGAQAQPRLHGSINQKPLQAAGRLPTRPFQQEARPHENGKQAVNHIAVPQASTNDETSQALDVQGLQARITEV